MKYAYYPGCSLHSTGKDYDISAKAVCQALGIELQEIPGWICCGASSAHATSELLSLALPVKDLVLAGDMGLDTAVCCAACYSRLKVANHVMSSGENQRSEDVDRLVGSRYRGEVEVKHLLEIIIDEYGLDTLREKVSTDLGQLRVASYYGCLLTRPPEVTQFDDPENPTSMDELVTALGAKAVAWPYKTECCGASLALTARTDVALKLVHDILDMAVGADAECIMVACPLCQANLDMRQAQINRRYGTEFNLPILYFTQLIGLAMAMSPGELGLSKLMSSPTELLRAKALV
ncbi:MAG: CoB--CoM heterodisulfide reductase iron-sulfur subunit B family protein [Anaerolineae bacterium]|nr:CoB--CoM heterodisulfide reductase iron-sulfur subunit B family protein [Anaerolineae bacterium]